jgi:hypothetical protein
MNLKLQGTPEQPKSVLPLTFHEVSNLSGKQMFCGQPFFGIGIASSSAKGAGG